MKVFISDYPKDEGERKIEVEISDHDVWNLDNTLAHIIAPALKELVKDKQGSPFVDDEDVPDEIKSTNAPAKKNDWDTDEHWHERWNYVLNEMIWAFDKEVELGCDILCDEESARKANGFRLFGKYYGALWT